MAQGCSFLNETFGIGTFPTLEESDESWAHKARQREPKRKLREAQEAEVDKKWRPLNPERTSISSHVRGASNEAGLSSLSVVQGGVVPLDRGIFQLKSYTGLSRPARDPSLDSLSYKSAMGQVSGPLWTDPQSELQVSDSVRFTCPYPGNQLTTRIARLSLA